MLWWILGIIGGVIGLVVLFALFVTVVGMRQPPSHTASRTLTLKQTPEAVWAVVSDPAGHTAWQPFVQYVKRLPDRDGKEAWEFKHKGAGNPPMTLLVTEKSPPRRMVHAIDDAKKVFSGRWEFDITPTSDGSCVAITENGTIPNPFFRGMFKLFGRPDQFIVMYLKALAGKFGEPAVIV